MYGSDFYSNIYCVTGSAFLSILHVWHILHPTLKRKDSRVEISALTRRRHNTGARVMCPPFHHLIIALKFQHEYIPTPKKCGGVYNICFLAMWPYIYMQLESVLGQYGLRCCCANVLQIHAYACIIWKHGSLTSLCITTQATTISEPIAVTAGS